MTVLDAFAVVAYLRAEPAAEEVKRLLDAGDAQLTAVGVGEVIDQLVRLIGADEEQATLDLAQLGVLDGIRIDSRIGAAAGRLRGRYYHRARCAVSMADCLAIEAARSDDKSLASSDPHVLDVCHAEGIPVVVLSDSKGTRWSPPV